MKDCGGYMFLHLKFLFKKEWYLEPAECKELGWWCDPLPIEIEFMIPGLITNIQTTTNFELWF